MPTQNATITAAWSKIADAADDPLLIQSAGLIEYQIATAATETAPSVLGHSLYGAEKAISRDLIGDGHIYARLTGSTANVASGGIDSATLIVTGSSEALS